MEVFRKVVSGHTGVGDERTWSEFCLSIVKGLSKNLKQCPKELVSTLLAISVEAAKKPWARQADTALACALSFFSLQIVTPAIVNPYKSGIVVSELSVEILKHFAGIGKCFQTWANEFQAQQGEEQKAPLGEGPKAVRRLCEKVMAISNLQKQQVTYEPDTTGKSDRVGALLKAFEVYCEEKK